MKINKISIIFPVLIILVSFLIAIYFYPLMPSQIATHWGVDNQANGYSSKAFGLFFMPFLSLLLLFLFAFLPQTDPYKKNFNQFKKYFQAFINLIFIFLFYLYLLTIVWNLGFTFNMIQVLSPAFAVIFFYAGILMKHAKRNWFVGIRTPWTMSSEKVWDKTHIFGAKLFKLSSLLCLLSLFYPNLSVFFIFVPILASSLLVFIYSYIEYRKR